MKKWTVYPSLEEVLNNIGTFKHKRVEFKPIFKINKKLEEKFDLNQQWKLWIESSSSSRIKEIENKIDLCNSYLFANKAGKILGWLRSTLKNEDKNSVADILSIFSELFDNAYRYGVIYQYKEHPAARCTLEAYIGQKGTIIGTTQEEGFLTKEQIRAFKTKKLVKPAHGCGKGVYYITKQGDGIFISEKEKAIYISKYFSRQ